MNYKGLSRPFQPDWRAWVDNIRRKGTPRRVHQIEFWTDIEIVEPIVERFGLGADWMRAIRISP